MRTRSSPGESSWARSASGSAAQSGTRAMTRKIMGTSMTAVSAIAATSVAIILRTEKGL